MQPGCSHSRRVGKAFSFSMGPVYSSGARRRGPLGSEFPFIIVSVYLLLLSLGPTEIHAQLLAPATHWTDQTKSEQPPPRSPAGGMAYDSARRRVVMFGGADGGIPPQSDTWEWDGTSWSLRVASQFGPSPRLAHAMCYDEARRRVVLFGGNDGNVGGVFTYFGDTWEWDGVSWAQRSSTGPAPRSSLAMAYDYARGRVVLFGGLVWQGQTLVRLNDMWEWNGTSWAQIGSPTPPPPPRSGHTLVSDAARGRLVLFGGIPAGGGALLGDTWEWDGTSWMQAAASGPPPRANHAMAYDMVRRRVVVFGGWAGTVQYLADTWEWDGNSWTQRIVNGPIARQLPGMVYDQAHAQAVLFGGFGNNMHLGDTWTYEGIPVVRNLSVPTEAATPE
jgi:hypothetical protein